MKILLLKILNSLNLNENNISVLINYLILYAKVNLPFRLYNLQLSYT